MAVGERHHEISASLPDHGRDRDLVHAEAPRAGKGQVVVEPALRARADRLPEAGGQIFGELAGQHRLVDVGEQCLERGSDVGGGDVLELFVLMEQVRPQLAFALDRSGELGYVLLSHASHPVQARCPIGGDAGDHQHCRGRAEPGSAGQGMRATTGPASYQAAFGANRGQDSGGVGGHVHHGPARLAG